MKLDDQGPCVAELELGTLIGVYAKLSGKDQKMAVAKNKSPKITQGTVLAIPLNGNEWALGQVIIPGISFYLGIVAEKFREPLEKSCIDGKKFCLFSWTNDAEVFNRNWKNLGTYELQDYGALPEYKMGIGDDAVIESFFGDVLRRYDPVRDKDVQHKKMRSPLLVQDAVRAAFGFGEWLDSYNAMKVDGQNCQ